VFTGAGIGTAAGVTAGGGALFVVEEQAARKSAAIALARSKNFIDFPLGRLCVFSLLPREKVARSAG
jgi:hypothetical protein